VLAGFTTDICVLFTAADAYMRDLQIIIPEDCSAAPSIEDHEYALAHMARVLDAKVVMSQDIDFGALLDKADASERETSGSK
jgi:nicotinamidase-related amidase